MTNRFLLRLVVPLLHRNKGERTMNTATLTQAPARPMSRAAVAWHQGAAPRWCVALLALLSAICIQIGTNLLNDVGDFERGADGPDRQGPLRATAQGLLTPHEVRCAGLGALAAAFVLVGSVGVYAVSQLLKTPEVTEHTVSVGNTEYVDDDAIMATEAPATVELISTEESEGSTKWQTKKVETVNGYTNTWLTYATYADAAEEAGMSRWLGDAYTADAPVDFVQTEGQGLLEKEVRATFSVQEGTVRLVQGITPEGVAEDAAYSIQMGHPINERSYTAGSGLEFRLVDDAVGEGQPLTTYVIAYDQYTGYLAFTDLSEEEIHAVLDAVTIN